MFNGFIFIFRYVVYINGSNNEKVKSCIVNNGVRIKIFSLEIVNIDFNYRE